MPWRQSTLSIQCVRGRVGVSFVADRPQARNVVRYLEVLNHVLPVGGIWINAGPLLWHYENNGDLSIELTLEEMLGLVEQMGFELLVSRSGGGVWAED